jgi:hypothetical protein
MTYNLLFAAFLTSAALNMLAVHGGFLTNYLADFVVPAWLYVASRGLHSTSGRTTWIQRTVGKTPEFAALTLFTASALTEVSQFFWPHGIFSGRFDAMDIVAYAAGIAACYLAERLTMGRAEISDAENGRPAA